MAQVIADGKDSCGLLHIEVLGIGVPGQTDGKLHQTI